MAVNQKQPLARRVWRFLTLRLLPALLVGAILWFGNQTVQSIVRQLDERDRYINQFETFAGTATALDLVSSPTPTPTVIAQQDEVALDGSDKVGQRQQPERGAARLNSVYAARQEPTSAPVIFATSTPQQDDQQVPQEPSPVEAASPTPVPPVESNEPLPTLVPMIPASEGQIINGTAVPTQVPYVPREGRNLVNIMLLGGDDELSQDGYGRTDTMIIVSINKDAGSVSMLSLPRDLFVYVPTTSGMMERLNIVYDFGEVNGYTGGGIGLLRQTILYNFGINVHYYARVNFSGFKEIIDAVGGVGIAVDCAYEDYQLLEAELPDGVIGDDEDGWVLPVGYYQMNGAQALWYVRSRHNSSDFDRGRRQQQLLRALWHQGRAELSITNAPNLWNQMMEVVDTNVPFQEFVSLVPLALNLDLDRIQSYTLTRTYHTIPWQPPNGSYVQLPVYDTVRPLLEDFYRPPPAARLAVAGSSIAVYNGTENANWDRVAAERLGWEGLAAYAAGSAETQDHAETVLIDYTGQQRGSSAPQIAAALNISSENIRFEPDPDRVADYAVILGSNYNSCDASVVPVDDI